MIRAILLGITLSEAKLITLYPSSDVYVEAGAPTFSQLTSILQVGKMIGQAPWREQRLAWQWARRRRAWRARSRWWAMK